MNAAFTTLAHKHNIKIKDGYALFWGSPFSNWYKGTFIESSHVNEISIIKFNCAEQHMMYHKAMLFDDHHTAAKILKSSDPREQKELGKLVSNYDDAKWSAVRYDVVKLGNYHKYSQNADFKQLLILSDGLTIVEASPKDTIWGIGLGANDPNATIPDKWRGTNLLGKALMDVRKILIEESK